MSTSTPTPTAQPDAYPAKTKIATATIDEVDTVLTSISLADKILLTISQHGRLSHWIHVPLSESLPSENPIPSFHDHHDEDADEAPQSDLLPMNNLTATTILGGRDPERETFGQLLASQIASAVVMRDPEERRMLVLGLGLEKSSVGREGFLELVTAAVGVL